MRILYGPSVTVMGKIIYNRKFNDNEERGVNGQVKPLVVSWLLKNMGFILVSVRNGVHIGFLIHSYNHNVFFGRNRRRKTFFSALFQILFFEHKYS